MDANRSAEDFLPEMIRTNGATGLLRPPPLPGSRGGCENTCLFWQGWRRAEKGTPGEIPGADYLPMWGI
jgi:hypothetical protein